MKLVEIQQPSVIDGFKCYAPAAVFGKHDFPREDFDLLYRSEAESFWFRGRQRIIEYLVNRFLPVRPASFLEVGCGTGFVLKGLSKLKGLEVMGGELHLEGLKWAKERIPDVELIQFDATQLPFRECFDAIGAFDVIEHIDADELVLQQMGGALKSQGVLFLTVPQHPWLWSALDERGYHKRRYTRRELSLKLQRAGFRIRLISSFVTFLLPAMALSRLIPNRPSTPSAEKNCELRLPPWLDRLFELSLNVEEKMLRCGIRLPFGGSLMAVAQKC
jgi:SAM-dependent methyltransferase